MPSARLPLSALILSMVLWGSSFAAQKYALLAFSPMAMNFGRMAVASACFVFLIGRLKGIRQHYSPGDWWKLLLLALFEPCLYFIFEAWALTKTSASQAGMIVAMMPLLIALAARFALKETLPPRMLPGFVVAITGAAWLSVAGEATGLAPEPVLGNVLELVAVVFATGYTISSRRLAPRYPPLFLTAVQALVGAIFFLPLMLIAPGPPIAGLSLAQRPLLAVLYLGVFVSLGAYALYNYALSKVSAVHAAPFINLIPVFSLLIGRSFLGEKLTPGQYAASILVLAGCLISQSVPRDAAVERSDGTHT
ncbi:DMT family transporter [Sorangium sp. So ce291]|uniref:DMT family transporter n=1 Tax=Sorangium sp. So ce291 TaxID=3133294 RepID=UPI003F639B3C